MMNTLARPHLDTGPWYKQRWPWLLMLGPFSVVIASFVSAWVAIASSDGLVADDYYKEGLDANKTIASSELANKLGLTAGLRLTAESTTLTLTAKDASYKMPPVVEVTLSHPTRAGLDQTQKLAPAQLGSNVYSGHLRLPRSGHWLVIIRDQPETWRLLGNVVLPVNGEALIGSGVAADYRS